MLSTDRIIVVEGVHDRDAVAKVADATVIQTDGFRIFKDKELKETLRELARRRGVIILTDSDRAGFKIRKYVEDIIGPEYVSHAYIPDVYGKERRKSQPSKEGKLGVEGMSGQVIMQALMQTGAVDSGRQNMRFLTKTDFYEAGLSGGDGSARKRDLLKQKLGLPRRLSPNRLLDVLNIMLDRQQFEQIIKELAEDEKNV